MEKEIFALDKKETQQIGRWTASASELKDYKKKRTTKYQKIKTCRDIHTRPLKTMAINY